MRGPDPGGECMPVRASFVAAATSCNAILLALPMRLLVCHSLWTHSTDTLTHHTMSKPKHSKSGGGKKRSGGPVTIADLSDYDSEADEDFVPGNRAIAHSCLCTLRHAHAERDVVHAQLLQVSGVCDLCMRAHCAAAV